MRFLADPAQQGTFYGKPSPFDGFIYGQTELRVKF